MEFRSEQDSNSVAYMLDLFNSINGKVYMEIGCAQLGTLLKFRNILPSDGFTIGLDIRRYEPFWTEVSRQDISESRIYLFEGDSGLQEIADSVKKVLGDKKIDFLFIDGDHNVEPTQTDYDNYSKFVCSGGIIAFHDVDWSAVARGHFLGQGGAVTLLKLRDMGYQIETVPGAIGIGFIRRH